MSDERWTIILAGGEGSRLRSMAQRIEGDDRPKQFCRVLGNDTLLEQTRRRAARLVSPDRTLILLTRGHERFYAPLFASTPPGSLAIQPRNRGTAPAILYGLLRVAARAPKAAVALLPSDHYVSDDAALMAHVAHAFDAVDRRPDLVVLLGIEPDGPETAYGWIEPGEPIEGGPALFRARSFREKPARPVAESMLAAGGLWNSFVIVGRVPVLLALIRRGAPSLTAAFERVRSAIATAAETGAIATLYEALSTTDFSAQVLASRHANLAVLRVSGVAWSDLGEPERVRATLARAGIEPDWVRTAASA
jgi:mannose-1-phosphate guanylyltransferase